MSLLYAAYGSNLHPLRLGGRIASAQLVGCAAIAGWALRFHKRSNIDGSGKCDIVPAAGTVHVAVYRIDVDDRQRLDEIEGLAQGYDEGILAVPGIGDCFTYRASASHIDAGLAPMDWYREMVIRGCEFHGFPADYVDGIRAIGAVADSDYRRRAAQWRIVERLAVR